MLQTGGEADVAKYSKRTVRVTKLHNEECRRLLRLMGVPVVEVRPAPLHAAALQLSGMRVLMRLHLPAGALGGGGAVRGDVQGTAWCARSVGLRSVQAAGLRPLRMPVLQVYGTASEDMDSLTFATPKLIRNLMKPATQSVPINEYDYDKAGLLGCRLCLLQCTGQCVARLRHAHRHAAGAGGPEAERGPVRGPVHPVRLRLPGHHQGRAARRALPRLRASGQR